MCLCVTILVMCMGARDVLKMLESELRANISDKDVLSRLENIVRDLEREIGFLEERITDLDAIIEVCCDDLCEVG